MDLPNELLSHYSLLRRIDQVLQRYKPFHFCSFFEKLGLPVPRYFMGWSNLGGGDHGGADWEPANGLEIAGNHTNIGAFNVLTGRTVYVKPWDGASYGTVEIHANTISIVQTLIASGKGFGGGGGGGGGRHAMDYGHEYEVEGGGYGGSGVAGGANGVSGKTTPQTGGNWGGCTGGVGGNGGGTYRGGGSAGGNGGADMLHGQASGQGGKGGYAVIGGQGDSSTDESLKKGSGGGGAGGGGGGGGTEFSYTGGGGGSGNRGGGWIKLYATISISISGSILAKGLDDSSGNGANGGGGGGTSGNGGAASSAGSSEGGFGGKGQVQGSVWTGDGGAAAGGGILLKCPEADGISITGTFDNRGGGNLTTNGGTIKVFYSGSDPTSGGTWYYGRLYKERLATTFYKTFTETINLTDSFSRCWTIYRTFTETLHLTDTINVFRILRRVFTETIVLSDTRKKKVGKVFTENISLSDVFSRRWNIYRTYIETINLTDTVSKKAAKLFTETLHLQDTFSRIWHIYRTFTEKITLADTLRKKIGKTFIESLTLADTLVKRAIRQRAHLLQALEEDAMFPSGVVRNLQHGADAVKSLSPIRGDWYIAIDTQKVYVCFIDGSWVQIYP